MAACASCAAENPERAKFCLECGAALAADATPPERRLVTALFCDLVGSTALGEQLDPEALRVVMQRYYETMRESLEGHGGTVSKFIGDAVVGVFGIPVVHEDDAVRAARAALDMHAAIPGLNAALTRFGATLQIRVGLQSGEVLADEQAARFGAVAADAFNVAARLQASAGPGETIVGDATARLLGDSAGLERLDELMLEGKDRPVEAFRLLSAGARRTVRASTPLIGRERVLTTLRRAYGDAVFDRAGVLATVFGPPGIGKSRLAEELAAHLRCEATVLVGYTPAYGEGRTLAPVIEVLHAAADAPGADPGTVAQLLRELLAGLPDGEAVADRLADLLGVGSGAAAGQTSWAFRRLLERLAESQPLAVVIDDLHWADPSLLELLEAVVDEVRAPVLVLCLARPELLEQRPSWAGGKRRAVTVTLEPLPEDAAEELARLHLAGQGLGALASKVARAAEGNPLYLEQYAAMIAEGGDLELSVPPSIQGLLAARLDTVDRGDADVLSAAAVQGREFDVSTLARSLDGADSENVAASLERLERRDLVRPDDHWQQSWTFAHALVRDAAERRLPKQVRAELHERLAGILELEGERDHESVGLHLERAAALRSELALRDEKTAELEARAGRHLAAAGSSAFARLDLLATSSLLGRAAALLPATEPKRLALLPDLGVALTEIGRPEEAARLLETAIADAGSADLQAEALRATIQLLSTRIYLDPSDAALEQATAEAHAALAALERIGDRSGLAQAWVLIGYLGSMRGAPDPEASVRAVEHARACGRLREEIQAAGDLPNDLYYGGSGPDTIDDTVSRLGEGDLIVKATSLALRALAAGLRGDRAGFREHDIAAAEACASRGLDFLRAAHDSTLPLVLLELGDAAEADRRLRVASATMRRVGDLWWEFDIETWRLVPLLAQSKMHEVAVLLTTLESFEAPRALDSRIVLAIAHSRVIAERGRGEKALRDAREAASLAGGSNCALVHSLALENLARVETAHGRQEKARRALYDALAVHERRGSVPGAERVRTSLG